MRRLVRPIVGSALLVLVTACGNTSTPTTEAAPAAYVALGDSYTSFPVAPTQINEACGRSDQNYPHLVAAALKYTLADMSCAGAKLSALTSAQLSGTTAQFNALTTKTRLVTVSIGGNSHGFATVLLGNCYYVRTIATPDNNPCELRARAVINAGLKAFEPELVTAYTAIRTKAPQARVIVIGYPMILGDAGTCALYPIASGDVAYVNDVNTKVNDAMKQAAHEVGFEYLDLTEASRNHGVCSSDPWIAGLKTIPNKARAVHPFANEQQAVAALLEKMLK